MIERNKTKKKKDRNEREKKGGDKKEINKEKGR